MCRRRRGSGRPRRGPLLGSRRHRKDRVQRPRLDGRHQARPRQGLRLLAAGYGAGGPTRVMLNDCCSIPPRRTATGSASASARTRDRPAKPRRFTWCAHSVASPATPAPESGNKLTRFGPFSSQCRAGNVKIRKDRGSLRARGIAPRSTGPRRQHLSGGSEHFPGTRLAIVLHSALEQAGFEL